MNVQETCGHKPNNNFVCVREPHPAGTTHKAVHVNKARYYFTESGILMSVLPDEPTYVYEQRNVWFSLACIFFAAGFVALATAIAMAWIF